MSKLSKSRIIAWKQCPKRLWLQVNKPELMEVDDSSKNRMQTGNIVGELAREMYSDGILIENGNLSLDLQQTSTLLKSRPDIPLFEATLQANDVLVRLDLLVPEKASYIIGEVKSSTKVKDYHLADSAIQTWIARKSGLKISRTELVHINNSFVYRKEGDYQGLFKASDITEQISPLEQLVPQWIEDAKTTLDGKEPKIEIGKQCHSPLDCPFLAYCTPEVIPIKYPLSDLKGKITYLADNGYQSVEEVPENELNNDKQRRIWKAVTTQTPYLDEEASKTLSALDYPRYYIDFETVMPAIPVFINSRPYQQIPFQWSCHIEYSQGEIEHYEYLGDGMNDPRKDFIATLVECLGSNGPVFVYNAAFEKTRLKELAKLFPEYHGQVETINRRVIDLLPIARNNYYHADMHGSWSIKAVLPTVAPDLDYQDLDVAHGGMAMDAYIEMMDSNTTRDRFNYLKNGLLEYCKLDTWAMVVLAHYFEGKS